MKKFKVIIFLIIILGVGVGIYFMTINEKNNVNDNVDKDIDNDEVIIEDEKLSYYKDEFEERYNKYQELNPDLNHEDVVTKVNIGLDNEFYTNINEVVKLNDVDVLVNKYNHLPSDFVPANLELISNNCSVGGIYLVDVANDAFEQLCQDAKSSGYVIRAVSTYRSYSYQNNLYNNYVARDGVINADTYSARAGHSEHQTGLAVDVDNISSAFTSFGNTNEFNWMSENAYKYGFILRYPLGYEHITGYQYESWHYRYVGVELATAVKNSNLTYDEYYVQYID